MAYHVPPFATQNRNSQLKAERTGDTVAFHRSETTVPLNHLARGLALHIAGLIYTSQVTGKVGCRLPKAPGVCTEADRGMMKSSRDRGA